MKREELFSKFMTLGWRPDPQALSVFNFLADAAENIPPGSILLDLGAGQCRYSFFFEHCHYIGVDFALGDANWDYSRLDMVGDICSPSFLRDQSVDFILNTVTMEHLNEPGKFLEEAARILKPGGSLFLYAPMTANEHQIPYDFYRYTSYGLRHLCEKAELNVISCLPSNGPLYTATRWSYVFLGALQLESLFLKFIRKGLRGLFKYFINPISDRLDKYSVDMSMPMLWLLIARKEGEKAEVISSDLSKEQVVDLLIQCPDCSAILEKSKDGYTCAACKQTFTCKGTQINFLETSPTPVDISSD
jgi:SAM-dependent methyltransferase